MNTDPNEATRSATRPQKGNDANRIAVERDLQRCFNGPSYSEAIASDTKTRTNQSKAQRQGA